MSPTLLIYYYALGKLDSSIEYITKEEANHLLVTMVAISLLSMTAILFLFALPLCRRLQHLENTTYLSANGKLPDIVADTAQDELGSLSRLLVQLTHASQSNNQKHELDKQSLSHQATHDELTGLCNRKFGNETISRLNNSASEYPTSILFLDLDGFKAVNDTCGHAIGDEILVAISLRLKAVLDKSTVLIRWGGDEFVIVLPEADQRRAISVAQDVAGLFRQPISTTQGVHKLGCSIGLATSRSGTSLEDILHEADVRMYENKKKRKSIAKQADHSKNICQASKAKYPDQPDAGMHRAA
ncbi:MAG: GGDEF domain-containing protein [Granulosicoccus sp.]